MANPSTGIMATFTRLFLSSAILGAVGVAAYLHYAWDLKQRQIDELSALNRDMEQRLEQRRQMIERLSRSHRIAHLKVTDQQSSADGSVISTSVLFIELDDQGTELARQYFTVPGDTVFVDAWTIKFDADAVAMGDPMRGRSLVLLRRIYSEQMTPADGEAIDTPGAIPPGYAASEQGQFEQRLWETFWELASNPDAASRMGVRVAQGEAVYKPVQLGQRFELVADAIGGLSLVPLGAEGPAVTQAAD